MLNFIQLKSSISAKLFLALLLFSIPSFLAVGLTFATLFHTKTVQKQITKEAIPLLFTSKHLSQALQDQLLLLDKVTFYEEGPAELKDVIYESRQLTESLLSKLDLLTPNNPNLALIKSDIDEINQLSDELQILTFVEKPKANLAFKIAKKELKQQLNQIRKQLLREKISGLQWDPKNKNAISSLEAELVSLEEILQQFTANESPSKLTKLKTNANTSIKKITHLLFQLNNKQLRKAFAKNTTYLYDLINQDTGAAASITQLHHLSNKTKNILQKAQKKEIFINQNINILLNTINQTTHQQLTEFDKLINQNMKLVVLLLICMFALGIGSIFLYIIPRITKRLKTLALATENIATGDYNVSIDNTGHDELSRMGTALTGFKSALIAKQQLESEQEKDSKTLTQLYQLSLDNTLSFEQKMHALLKQGLDYYGLDLGIVSKINLEENEYEVFEVYPQDALQPGQLFEVSNTYCVHTYQSNGVQAWHHAGESEIASHPCYQNFGLNSYIGTVIYVNNIRFGTINFTKVSPREKPFTDSEKAFINLFAQWLSHEITRHQSNLKQEQLIDKLTNSNEELARYAYICSHDLQEPFRMIRSFSEKLHLHIGFDNLDEKGQRYLHFINDGAARAQEMISGILNYSRIDGDINEMELIDTMKLVQSVKNALSSELETINGDIQFKHLPTIQGNKTQLYQLFQNLINNGLKYQQPNTQPLVEVSATALKTHWQFAIKDNGIGIEERHFTKIFDIFQRLHRNALYSGTGIGLSICKKVVERHHGKIWLESKPGEGTTFYFTIAKNSGGQHDIKN